MRVHCLPFCSVFPFPRGSSLCQASCAWGRAPYLLGKRAKGLQGSQPAVICRVTTTGPTCLLWGHALLRWSGLQKGGQWTQNGDQQSSQGMDHVTHQGTGPGDRTLELYLFGILCSNGWGEMSWKWRVRDSSRGSIKAHRSRHWPSTGPWGWGQRKHSNGESKGSGLRP